MFYRVLLVSLFLGGTIVFSLRGEGGVHNPTLPYLYALITFYYFQALVFSAALRNFKIYRFLVHTQVVCDLLFASVLIYITGGIESHFSFLFLLIILGGSLLLSRREALVIASASAILYGSLLDLQFYRYLPHLSGLIPPITASAGEVFYTVFVNVVAFLLVGLFGGIFAERVRHSELALERREIDFEELEKLNRTIIANIGSGLMIVNTAGRIRAFNNAAENITGLKLLDVYNRDVREIFPNLNLYDGQLLVTDRGEGEFALSASESRVIGYSSILMEGDHTPEKRLLVSFQDLTHLRDVEIRLQNADRLAAIGKMASGMAHEIRNPLASISGSLQLLIEGGQIASSGENLAHIVVREADRLSGLITNFLSFARPARPQKNDVDVVSLCNDVITMAESDPRLKDVDIERNFVGADRFWLDVAQLRQVLWDLILNAAEAMSGHGRIRISVDADRKILCVEDSGPGIAEHIRTQIFDPFYSTKEMGTGLGLATVYATIEAHGGTITVGESALGGALFEVLLPSVGRPSAAYADDIYSDESGITE